MDRETLARKLGQLGYALESLSHILLVRELTPEEQNSLKQTLATTYELIQLNQY